MVFDRNCGATTPFSTQISVLSSTESVPVGAGNTVVLHDGGEVRPVVHWLSESAVRISYPASMVHTQHEDAHPDVHVTFDTAE